jgi:hypothetical protein
MNKVEFSIGNDDKVTLYFSGNLNVSQYTERKFNPDRLETAVRVDDGRHNNGGWRVNHTYEDVIAKIDAALNNRERK